MTAPLFSVLIDTFNYGKYIEEAVCSVLQQDFPAAQREILVIDDGSTDDTEKRLERFGDAIRYLKKPNGGQPPRLILACNTRVESSSRC